MHRHAPQSSPARAARPCRFAAELSRFTQFMAEVLAGERAPDQMRPLLTRSAYSLLRRRAGIYASPHRPRVRRTFVRAAGADATEVSAVVDCGTRCRALALRVAAAGPAWLCTHFETDAERRPGCHGRSR